MAKCIVCPTNATVGTATALVAHYVPAPLCVVVFTLISAVIGMVLTIRVSSVHLSVALCYNFNKTNLMRPTAVQA